MSEDLVSVVCVNWNGEKHIRRTIDSLLNQSYSALEIIIVDNNSKDNSVRLIKENYPQVILIENKINSGWPAGLNTGIKKSRGEYIVSLNNDAWLDKMCIGEMVRAVNKDKSYGSCAAKIYLDKDKIEVAGVKIYIDGLSCARGRLQSQEKFEEEEEVFCASGCCGLYKKEMIDKIGLYEERFFLYGEDTEFGWRHQLAGWKCIYNPGAIVFHEHSASSGDYSHLKAFYVERNRIWVALIYYPVLTLIFKVPFFSIYRYLYQIILSLTKKEGSLAKFRENNSLFSGVIVLIKTYLSAFMGVPYCLKKRQQILKKNSNKKVEDLLGKYGCSTKEIASYE